MEKLIFDERYIIHEDGTVISNVCRKSINKGKHIVQPFIDKDGYKRIAIFVTKTKRQKFYVHRLVAMYFLEPVENKNLVNHKDGNKQNNHYTNLEWYTNSENQIHAIQTGLIDLESRRDKSNGRFIKSECSTTRRKPYTQVSGNGEHL